MLSRTGIDIAITGMDSLAPVETVPGSTVATDQEMTDWLRDHMGPSNGHMVGTAAMAPRSLGGVVGADLRVHGTRRLSIADNSIVNLIPATHTSSTAYAIGEKVGVPVSSSDFHALTFILGGGLDSETGKD